MHAVLHHKVPDRIILDIDDTFDAVHGGQQLRLFNAHYDEYGFQPIVVFDGEGRFITADQRYLIWKSCHEKSEAWAEKRRIADEANRKRAEAAKQQHDVSNPRAGETLVDPQLVGRPEKRDHAAKHAASSTTAKAAASKTNRGTVERMDSLAANRPDLADKVKTGERPA